MARARSGSAASSSSAVTASIPAAAQLAPGAGLGPLQDGDSATLLQQPPADAQTGHPGADDDDLHSGPSPVRNSIGQTTG